MLDLSREKQMKLTLSNPARDYRASYELLAQTVETLHAKIKSLREENDRLRGNNIVVSMSDTLACAMSHNDDRLSFPFDP